MVRLTGPRRVEVHEPGRAPRTAGPGEELRAPGVLRNPIPVEALYDWRVGQRVALRNLLQRQGYEDLDAVLAEGRAQGETEGRAQGEATGQVRALQDAILAVAEARGLESSDLREAVAPCGDIDVLKAWLRQAATAMSPEGLARRPASDASSRSGALAAVAGSRQWRGRAAASSGRPAVLITSGRRRSPCRSCGRGGRRRPSS